MSKASIFGRQACGVSWYQLTPLRPLFFTDELPYFAAHYAEMQNRIKNNLSEIPGKAAIWSDDDGLSWLTFEPGADIRGQDAIQLLELAKKTYVETEYFRVIIDLRTNPQITTAARNFAANATPGFISAFAILTNGLTMKLIADFFIQFHKPLQPTKIFTDEEEARKWLLKQRDKK